MWLHKYKKLGLLLALVGLFSVAVLPQQTNPVEKQVSNPITDTPDINPIIPDTVEKTAKAKKEKTYEGGDGELVVYSDAQTVEGKEGTRIVSHSGNVDVKYGYYRIQADKVTVSEATNQIVATGNVIFDQGDDQRITGSRGEWNYKTKLGYFVDSTGFTNQTNDGTVVYFTAERVERIGLNEIKVINGKFTSCVDSVPKWSFTAEEALIKANDAVILRHPKFRIKDVPVFLLPYARIPIRKDDRKSGFLTPTASYSATKGFRLSNAYYQTLGRSADATLRLDLFSARGIGYGVDVRTRANSRSYFNFGFFAVKDRIFGAKEDNTHPNQGGTFVHAEGIHYFTNGFTASVDVKLTSSLAFRQVFSDGIQQVISPIEVSQAFVSKSWDSYTLNVLARSQVISIPNVRIKTRNLPSIDFEKRPTQLSFFKNAYFSFNTSLEGVSRREDVDDLATYRQIVGSDPTITPAIGQRFDVHPQVIVPFSTKYFNFTATAGSRVTFYSDSFDSHRQVLGRDLTRKYGEFEFEIRPVALARNFYGKKDEFLFRHTIEPFLTYRLVKGINEFQKTIRFDYVDTITDTNEIEFGVTNRIFTRRYTEAVTPEAQKELNENAAKEIDPISIQPYELFTFTIRGKYFFDKTFGGALTPGRRNQIYPITTLTAFTFGGIARAWSPLNLEATYRPKKTVFINSRMDLGVQGDGLRDISATIGYDTKLFKFFQTFYYTRAVTLMPSLAQYADSYGKEAGTLRGSQWSPTVFLGDRNNGWYGGAALFFDFQNRRATSNSPLVNSVFTLGYAYDCCSVSMQAFTFNLGIRHENRYVFSFRLNGIGAFGTEQFGQGIR